MKTNEITTVEFDHKTKAIQNKIVVNGIPVFKHMSHLNKLGEDELTALIDMYNEDIKGIDNFFECIEVIETYSNKNIGYACYMAMRLGSILIDADESVEKSIALILANTRLLISKFKTNKDLIAYIFECDYKTHFNEERKTMSLSLLQTLVLAGSVSQYAIRNKMISHE